MSEVPLKEIPETDKPFYLALLSTAVFVMIFVFGAVGAIIQVPDMIEFAKWGGTSVFGLMSMAWTFYFVKKELTT